MNVATLSTRDAFRKPPELSWLTGGLAISPEPDPMQWPAIYRAGLRCVLDLRAESPGDRENIEAAGLRYLRVPVKEGAAPAPDSLRLLTDWIAGRMGEDGAVLVLCRTGRGRSAMVACASLVKLGVPPPDAFKLLRRARVDVDLSGEQQIALSKFAQTPREGA